MGSRKRSKPNPKAEAERQLPDRPKSEGHALLQNDFETAVEDQGTAATEAVSRTDVGSNTPRSAKSWYDGTWPRGTKAASITQVFKESISASGGAASHLVSQARSETPKGSSTSLKNPTSYLSQSIGSSSRSLPLAATTTKLNITSNASSIPNSTLASEPETTCEEVASKERNLNSSPGPDNLVEKAGHGAVREERSAPQEPSIKGTESEGKPVSEDGLGRDSSGWLAWFSKPSPPDGQNLGPARDAQGKGQPLSTVIHEASSINLDVRQAREQPQDERRNSDPSPVAAASQVVQRSRLWLSLWSNTNVQSEKSKATLATEPASAAPSEAVADTRKSGQDKAQSGHASQLSSQTYVQSTQTVKPQGWSFWSKDRFKGDHTTNGTKDNVGKLALAGSPSNPQPENAVVDEAKGLPNEMRKRERPQSAIISDDTNLPDGLKGEVERRDNIKPTKIYPKNKPANRPAPAAQKIAANLLLPPFKRTYRATEKPTILQHLGRILQYSQVPDAKHLDLNPTPPRIKRALAIGVHGYFPVPLIRSVLGQPTGTSIRFANGAASAIQRWAQNHGYSCEVEKVALEGEGKIAERIDLLWKLMLNWIEHIRKADFVMVACHSQGVPVAICLVAKLISFGCVNAARIGICAMAGINMGPFADYKSRWIGGSAGELFDFAQPESQVSKDYEAALDAALKFGVKIVYVGSIDDQLVSLESSTFGIVSHPYIYRAVFVDGRVHAPDFLTHLVGFALKLRNLGISDHGLIRELSTPLAGSLYGGEGHSRIYDDESVYYLAVEHALETTSIGSVELKIQRVGSGTAQNPYILPFAIRGLLEEEHVRTELANETSELLRQFDDWKPSSKVLKDVKFRLEGIRAKL